MTFERVISQSRLDTLMAREAQIYESRTPNCRKAFEQAGTVLLNGVPMPWMGDWGTTYPLFMSHAKDNRITDIDGNDYIDFCLGDTGAMFGHSPEATARAVINQVQRGITTMLPTEDAAWVGQELKSRFGLPFLAGGHDRHRSQPIRYPYLPHPDQTAQDPGV